MAQLEFDCILLETGLLQTGFHAAGTPFFNAPTRVDDQWYPRSPGTKGRPSVHGSPLSIKALLCWLELPGPLECSPSPKGGLLKGGSNRQITEGSPLRDL